MSDQENTGSGMDESKKSPRRRCCGHEGDGNGWWHDRSLPVKILMGIGFGILGVCLLAFLGWVVMALWNWLMPELFGLKRIGYWQAWGLLILCKILFHGCGSGSGGVRSDRKRRHHLRRYMREHQPPAEAAIADS